MPETQNQNDQSDFPAQYFKNFLFGINAVDNGHRVNNIAEVHEIKTDKQ